jgi:hypothetical protein
VRLRKTVPSETKPNGMQESNAVHVLLRVRSENGRTSDAHKEVLNRKGTAAP